jgi:hypothetical protein
MTLILDILAGDYLQDFDGLLLILLKLSLELREPIECHVVLDGMRSQRFLVSSLILDLGEIGLELAH